MRQPSTHWLTDALIVLAAWAAIIMATVFGVLLYSTFKAHAHDDADWIRRGNLKNAIGELCCGPNDCKPLADEDVKITADGYRVKGMSDPVPFHEAAPTPPQYGGYWMCVWGGKFKCFFAPPPNT